MSNVQSNSLPSHRIFSVVNNGGKKAAWHELGAVWPHKDGKGFNLQFAARPLEGAALVLRAIEPKVDEQAAPKKTGKYAALDAVTPRVPAR